MTAALAGRYLIEREIGAGGMATVYLGHDVRHDRDVAIKVLHPDLGAALGSERFLAEIKTTARLQHPHILPLLDSGEAEGLLFYVMPFVNGETLRSRLEREGQLPIDEAVHFSQEIADALGAAHALSIVHRDIKPENVLLQGGHARVADFGIALAVQQAGGARMTQTGLSLGTPQYMSPEQAMGERTIDHRADIYALGAVTYEMLVGDPPFTGSSVQAIVARALTERPTSPRALRDTVPMALDQAVLKALAKLPADRFASAPAFAAALTAPSATATAVASAPASLRERRRLRVAQSTAVLAVLVAVAAFIAPRAKKAHSVIVKRQLTFDRNVIAAAISPDGAWLALLKDDCLLAGRTSCTFTLEVREVDGSTAVRIATWTRIVGDIRFTGDGKSLIFRGAENGGTSHVYITDRLGGTPRQLAPSASAMTMMADGRTLTLASGNPPQQWLFRYDVSTLALLDSARLPLGVRLVHLAASRDGTLAAVASVGGFKPQIVLLAPSGVVLDTLNLLSQRVVRWDADGDAILVYNAGDAGGAGEDLLRIPVRRGRFAPDQMVVVAGQIPSGGGRFDVAANGRMALMFNREDFSLILGSLASNAGKWRTIIERPGILAGPPAFSKDGKSVILAMTDNVGENIYGVPLDGGSPRALTAYHGWDTTGARWAEHADMSPDGTHIVFIQGTGSGMEIAFADIGGGRSRRIGRPASFTGLVLSWLPIWLGNDRILAHHDNWLVAVDTSGIGRDSVHVPDSLGSASSVSIYNPAERSLYFGIQKGPSMVAADFRTHMVRAVAPTPHTFELLGWTPDGAMLAYPYGKDTVYRADAGSRLTFRPISVMPPGCRGVAVDRSGTSLACVRSSMTSDVWLAELRAR